MNGWFKLHTHWYEDVRFEQLGERHGGLAFAIPILLLSIASQQGPTSGVKISPARFSRVCLSHERDVMPVVESAIEFELFAPLRYHAADLIHLRPLFGRRQSRPSVDRYQRERIVQRDRGICGICGRVVGLEDVMEIDHIYPLSRGGTNQDSNLQVSHFSCNRAKAARV